MNTKLNHVKDWPSLSKQANWSVAGLAKLNGVSGRTLHRHFIKHMGQKPRDWLAKHRQTIAFELLREGASVKETAACLGYKHATNLTRKLKTVGIIPIRQQIKNKYFGPMSQNDSIWREMIAQNIIK